MVPGFANELIWTGYSAGTASFTVPAGYTQVRATLTASGGGGTDGTANSCGGGGGGSAEATVLIQVTAGEVLTLTYPQGGGGALNRSATDPQPSCPGLTISGHQTKRRPRSGRARSITVREWPGD
jgi:hypothetical protein